MSIGDDVAWIMPKLRCEAVSRMTDTVQVTTTDQQETGGLNPKTVTVTHYAGPARVKFSSQVVSDREVAGQFPVVQSVELHLPSGTVVPPKADVLVTGSRSDPALVGRRFTVTGMPQAGQTTAARYPVKEVS